MTTGLKIKEVADASGFTAATLRYYEQIGLLPEASRTPAGYRMYDQRTLERLAFIARAKQLGCSLDEITGLTTAWTAASAARSRTSCDDSWPARSPLHSTRSPSWRPSPRNSSRLQPRSNAIGPTAPATPTADASATQTHTPDATPGPACRVVGQARSTGRARDRVHPVGGVDGRPDLRLERAARPRRTTRTNRRRCPMRVRSIGAHRRADPFGRGRARLLPVLPVRDHRRHPRCCPRERVHPPLPRRSWSRCSEWRHERRSRRTRRSSVSGSQHARCAARARSSVSSRPSGWALRQVRRCSAPSRSSSALQQRCSCSPAVVVERLRARRSKPQGRYRSRSLMGERDREHRRRRPNPWCLGTLLIASQLRRRHRNRRRQPPRTVIRRESASRRRSSPSPGRNAPRTLASRTTDWSRQRISCDPLR